MNHTLTPVRSLVRTTLAPFALSLVLVLVLTGCGGGTPELATQPAPKAQAQAQALQAPQAQALVAVVPNSTSAPCPAGASFDTALGFCADGSNAYGPFTQAMTDACRTNGGGPACTTVNPYLVAGKTLSLQRWSYAFAKGLRGTATCPRGALANARADGRCVETIAGVANVYSGFPTNIVDRCVTLGGGNACYSTRWGANFYFRASLQHRLQNNLTAAWNGSGVPSVSVTLSTPDQGSVSATTGINAAGNRVDANVGQYRWASVTKNFTAAILMRLHETGRINIDHGINQYMQVPGLANQGSISIRELLNHSAGVGNYLDSSNSFLNSTNSWRLYSNSDILRYINEVGPSFFPGSAYKYSNGGFAVLGMLIEKVEGMPIESVFAQWLTTPMGLNNTFLDVASSPTNKIPNLVESARAYAYSTTSVKADGALVSTSVDVAKYMRAVFSGNFLSATSKAAMRAPSLRNSRYGLGTIRFTSDAGDLYYGHTGTLLNYKSVAYYVPNMDVAVALSMNTYPSNAVLDRIEAAVYDTMQAQYKP